MKSFAHSQRTLASRLIVLALVFLTFAWRLVGLDRQSLWRDEVDAIVFALGDLESLLSMFVINGHNGALYFTLLRPWLWLSGSSEFALRYPSLLMGVLAVPMTWQVGRQLLPPVRLPESSRRTVSAPRLWPAPWSIFISEPGLLAAAFLATSPYQMWYSQEGKMYTATTLLVLAAIWLWLKLLSSSGGLFTWLALFLVISLGLYTHLLVLLLLPLLIAWLLVIRPQQGSRLLGVLLLLAGLIGSYAYRAPWLWEMLTTAERRSGFPFIPFSSTLQETFLYQLNGLYPLDRWLWLLPQVLLVGAGTLLGGTIFAAGSNTGSAHLSPLRRQLLIASWLYLPILALYTISLRQPLFAPRYIIWIAPAVMLALARGIQLLRQCERPWSQGLAVLLVIYVLAYSGAAGWRQRTAHLKFDLRSAVSYIEQRRRPEELLILHIPYLEYAYRYYSGDQGPRPLDGSDARLGWWAGGLWTNHELDDAEAEAQADREMQALIEGATDVWVMRSEVEMWDARDLMDQWLRSHGQLMDQVTFNGIQALHYRLKP